MTSNCNAGRSRLWSGVTSNTGGYTASPLAPRMAFVTLSADF